MAYTYFDTSKANELAKFQGSFAGIQAGNSNICGTAMAPTSIYNQAGYYALQDTDTGYIHLQKMADDSLYTQNWYDQGTGTIFDFAPGGQGIVSTKPQTQSSSTTYNNATVTTNSATSSSSSSTSSTSSSSSTNGLIQYPWGQGYVAVKPTQGSAYYSTAVDGNKKLDENGNQIELTAKDIKELVQAGVYDSEEEALAALKKEGYAVSDAEQAKLNVYDKDTEKQIKLLMDKTGCTRDEALRQLGSKATTNDEKDSQTIQMYYNLVNNGFSRKEALDYLQTLGYKIPSDIATEPAKYRDKDEAKIEALMVSTGCTREEAINTLGVKPEEPGWLHKACNAVGDFFGGIGNAISDGWNAFCDWIW